MKRIAIQVHVFYPDLWLELARCVRNFQDIPYDLFVTFPEGKPEIRELVLGDFPAADVRGLENRGYDLGPFIDTLNRLDLSRYDYIVKLHTKRDVTDWINYWPLFGGEWRRRLLAFCASVKAVQKTLAQFESHPEIGMIAHRSLIVGASADTQELSSIKQKARDEIARFGIQTGREEFVAGTMFIARASLFKPMQGKVALSDFEIVHAHEPATLAHVYERVLGYLIGAQCSSIGRRNFGHFFLLGRTYMCRPFFYLLRSFYHFINANNGAKQ